ncbi:MoaD/ThiS family protein [Kineosporia sp. A_224]|uniref:MoaD/ThiS family protein n=1 Tax=Kineosporia sp. A_224 TaxID=1962180 RepID=UPI000B4A7ECB|nr:MoaD/ThiS family protein [Kineosporia sp. A_224]
MTDPGPVAVQGSTGAGPPPERSVVVVLPAALRDEADGRSTVTVSVPTAPAGAAAVTVGNVLDALAAAHPRLERRLRDERGTLRRHVNVFVAGDDCRALLGQDTPVPDGAEVVVLPNIAGG